MWHSAGHVRSANQLAAPANNACAEPYADCFEDGELSLNVARPSVPSGILSVCKRKLGWRFGRSFQPGLRWFGGIHSKCVGASPIRSRVWSAPRKEP